MKNLHTVTAVIELGAGLALLSFPSATVARVGGAALLALGVACWLARGDTQSGAARGLIVAMLLYDVAAVVVLAFAGTGFGLYGAALWPAVFLHAVMTVWCVTWLRRGPMPVSEARLN